MSQLFVETHHSRVLRTMLLAALAFATLPAVAQKTHPGPVGSHLIKNPHVDPANNQFGFGVTAGDFDGDGISDLAVTEVSGSRLQALLGVHWTVGNMPALKFLPTTVTSANHNTPMAVGDFDGDGRDELAIGAQDTEFAGQSSAGGVYVLDRPNEGSWALQSEIRAGNDGYPGAPQAGASLGNSLAAGDFDGDGFDDLAIGIFGQTVAGVAFAGAVMVVYGTADGLKSIGAQLYNRSSDGLSFTPVQQDGFGFALAAGDFDGDGNDDLAIGIPQATCPDGTSRAGAVVEMRGSSTNGITNTQSHIWRPGIQSVLGTCTAGAYFGAALVSARFNALRQRADLAIGAPLSSPGGDVHVLYGQVGGLSAGGNQRIAAPVQPGITSTNGRFGSALAAGDLGHSCALLCTADSLAVGAPYAGVGGLNQAGAVWLFDSQGNNLATSSARPFVASASLPIGAPHQNDRWGTALAVGDFNDDSLADLAIGVPKYDDGGDSDAGAVQVFYQSDYIFVGAFDSQQP